MKDKAYPQDADRGVLASAISAADGTVPLQWTLPGRQEAQVLSLLPDGRLKLSNDVHYTQASQRPDRSYNDFFTRISQLPPPLQAPQPVQAGEQAQAERPQSHAPPAERNPKEEGSFVPSNQLDGPPSPLQAATPIYTPDAIAHQVRGTVTFSLDIDEKGNVTQAQVTTGPEPDYGMDAACQQAASSMTFTPPTKEGVPVKTTWTFLMALNPPPLPKPTKVPKANVGLILESKANVQRFIVQVDGQVVFAAPMAGAMGNDVRVERNIPVLPGAHHFVATASFASGRTMQTQWDQTLTPGQQSVFNVWVPAFGGSIKMKRLQ